MSHHLNVLEHFAAFMDQAEVGECPADGQPNTRSRRLLRWESRIGRVQSPERVIELDCRLERILEAQ